MKTIRDYIDLVNEAFNAALAEKVTLNPDGSVPPTQTVNGVTMNAPANAVQTGSGGVLKTGSGAAVTSGTPAPAPDAAAAAKAKLTPSQLKWLGGADATDSIIMSRMPKPLPGESVPGAPAAAPAAHPGNPADWEKGINPPPDWVKDNATGKYSAPGTAPVDDRNEMDKASDAAASQNAAQAATVASGQPDDATGVDAAVAAQAAAPAQAAQAVKPKVMAKPDPAVMKIQQDLIAKGAKIKADGVMGPATQAAQKQFGANQTAPAAAGSFAADMAARKQAANPMKLAKEGRTDRNDHAFIDELNAMRSIAGLPTKNKW